MPTTRLYNAHVRSRLYYGVVECGSARQSLLMMLGPVRYFGLGLATLS